MSNTSLNTTPGYLEWRDTVAARDEGLFAALEKLTVPELYAAQDRLMGGLAAERLNPANSCRNFHFAAGLIRGLLYMAGHKLEQAEGAIAKTTTGARP